MDMSWKKLGVLAIPLGYLLTFYANALVAEPLRRQAGLEVFDSVPFTNLVGAGTAAAMILVLWCFPLTTERQYIGQLLYFGFTATLAGFLMAYCLWAPGGREISGWASVALFGAWALHVFSFRPFNYSGRNTMVFLGAMMLYFGIPVFATVALTVQ